MSTTLGELFGEVAAAFPDAVAYVEGDDRVTYSEWVRGADSLAATFAERGVGPGDVVAFYLGSSIDFAVGYAAASRLGAVATGINTRLGPNEITAILAKCEPAVLIHESPGDPVSRGRAPGRPSCWHATRCGAPPPRASRSPRPTRSAPRTPRASCGRAARRARRRARGSTIARSGRRPR